MTEDTVKEQEQRVISLKDFFEKEYPGSKVLVKDLGERLATRTSMEMNIPLIQLYCDYPSCRGIRFFESSDNEYLSNDGDFNEHFTTFFCKNCGRSFKTYAYRTRLLPNVTTGNFEKFGESPPFGPHTPSKLIRLFDKERDYYLKGRRSENQGLGIAAFAYYRRVIENQKNRIFDEIIRVSEKLGAEKVLIEELNAAKNEIQFSKAVNTIKHGIPQALLINGHNPIILLHSALSEGLHAQTDEECLELATSIRIVLTDLVERLDSAIKDEAELNNAVSRLLRRKDP